MLRGTAHFEELADYRRFVDEVIGRANARRRKLVDVERAVLQPLPGRRTTHHDEALVTISRNGGFLLRRVFYTVPSRLIGHRLRLRLYDDRLECLLGSTLVLTLPRGRPFQGRGAPNRTLHVVDYRHVPRPQVDAVDQVLVLWGAEELAASEMRGRVEQLQNDIDAGIQAADNYVGEAETEKQKAPHWGRLRS